MPPYQHSPSATRSFGQHPKTTCSNKSGYVTTKTCPRRSSQQEDSRKGTSTDLLRCACRRKGPKRKDTNTTRTERAKCSGLSNLKIRTTNGRHSGRRTGAFRLPANKQAPRNLARKSTTRSKRPSRELSPRPSTTPSVPRYYSGCPACCPSSWHLSRSTPTRAHSATTIMLARRFYKAAQFPCTRSVPPR